MANKHLSAKLGSVGDLARQYRELCELRVELERRTSRLEQSRPRHGRPTATDRPSGAEPKHLIFDGWTPRTISKKGRVARLNGEYGASSPEADGEPWPTLAARSAATAKSKPVGSLLAAFVCDKVLAYGCGGHRCRKSCTACGANRDVFSASHDDDAQAIRQPTLTGARSPA
jgi:hypothetical protein